MENHAGRCPVGPVDVQGSAEELGDQLTEAKFQAVLDGLTWGAAITGGVPTAINNLISDQVKNLTNVSNRIQAGSLEEATGQTLSATTRGRGRRETGWIPRHLHH